MAIAAIAEYQKDYGTKSHATECAAMLDDLNERLDRKAYESARLYFNMEDYKAARVAFRNTLKDNADNIYTTLPNLPTNMLSLAYTPSRKSATSPSLTTT